jgi:hypothetical protein
VSRRLTDKNIDEAVGRTSPGSYALGYLDGGTFVVFYVGRSDSDVNARLHSWIGVDGGSPRSWPSARAAYGTRHRRSLPLPTPALSSVGVVADSGYTHFEFSYAPSAKAAFEGECCTYHDFGGSYGSLDNKRHPAPPEGVSWMCPAHGSPVVVEQPALRR